MVCIAIDLNNQADSILQYDEIWFHSLVFFATPNKYWKRRKGDTLRLKGFV